MRHNRRAVLVPLGVAVAFLMSGCATDATSGSEDFETVVLHADYPEYESLEEASSAADVVVLGEFVSSEMELLYPTIDHTDQDPRTNPQLGVSAEDLSELAVVTTVSKMRVTEVLGGDAKVGDIITVSQLGGLHEGIKYVEENTTLLEDVKSDQVALILNDTGDGGFDLVNPVQGLYEVEGDLIDLAPSEKNSNETVSLEDFREIVG